MSTGCGTQKPFRSQDFIGNTCFSSWFKIRQEPPQHLVQGMSLRVGMKGPGQARSPRGNKISQLLAMAPVTWIIRLVP